MASSYSIQLFSVTLILLKLPNFTNNLSLKPFQVRIVANAKVLSTNAADKFILPD